MMPPPPKPKPSQPLMAWDAGERAHLHKPKVKRFAKPRRNPRPEDPEIPTQPVLGRGGVTYTMGALFILTKEGCQWYFLW